MILIDCPNCGRRNAQEFRYGGEYNPRPGDPSQAGDAEWADYLFMKANIQGQQKEWWYHRAGCQLWFLAERHTKTNVIKRTYAWSKKESLAKSEPDQE